MAENECATYGNVRCIWGGAKGRELSCRCGAPIRRPQAQDDPLTPARGLVFGVLFGVIIWAAIIIVAVSIW